MVLTCDNCGFIFSRVEETDQCPDCGKHLVRPADEAEQEEFATRMAELTRAERADSPRSPELEDTEFSRFCPFSVYVVEYGENPADRTELAGNAWARQEGGMTSNYLMSVHLPIKQGETPKEQVDRIFAALNSSGAFQSQLSQFILEQLDFGIHG